MSKPTVVISVPHSGSRSLCRHLGIAPIPESLWHFGDHDHRIDVFKGAAAIPIRNPVDVLASWLVRKKDPIVAILRMSMMVDYDNPLAQYFKVEELQERVGHRDTPGDSQRGRALAVFQRHAHPAIHEFYRKHGGYEI